MRKHITAFYLETLVLVLVFLGVLMVLAQVFGLAQVQSRRAGQLTEAVGLAERAAEAVASADSLEEVQSLLDEGGSTEIRDGGLLVFAGSLWARVTWEPDGGLVRSRITVYGNETGSEIYSLETAVRGEAVS